MNNKNSVFSMSAIDLFCSAMGVFIILCFITIPFYTQTNKGKENKESLNALLVSLIWDNDADIDLYVKDPVGRVFYYDKRDYPEKDHLPASSAGLAKDDEGRAQTDNDRIEIWLDPYPIPGTYQVGVQLHINTQTSTPPESALVVIKNSISSYEIEIETRNLKKTDATIYPIKFDISEGGHIRIIEQ